MSNRVRLEHEVRFMVKKTAHSFESYWRNNSLDDGLRNINTALFYAVKRQARKAYNAGRRHQKLKPNGLDVRHRAEK